MDTNISFIVPAFNCEKTIIECIESIYNNNFYEGDEVIIINDASIDNTEKIINKLAQKYRSIKILKHNINKGSAAASRNTGIDNSKNNLLFCLDSDNILEKDSISKLKSALIETKSDCCAFG